MEISAIIPTYNRAASLKTTIEAVKDQTLPADQFEVIVVDDGSEESVRREIRVLQKDIGFTLLEKENNGLASARNFGAEQARGDILFFLDDDVVPGPDTFAEHLKSHDRAGEPVAVVGSLPYPDNLKLNAFHWYLEQYGHFDLYKYGHRKYPGGKPPMPPMNGNSSVARSIFFKAGRYDESFRQYGGEDLDLGYRIAQAGIQFIYNPRAKGFHSHNKSFSQFCQDMELAGESLIRLYKKYPEIKAAKKIDVLMEPYSALPAEKKIMKLILAASTACPWMIAAIRWLAISGEPYFALRHVLRPFFRLVTQYYYAMGMKKGLTNQHGWTKLYGRSHNEQ